MDHMYCHNNSWNYNKHLSTWRRHLTDLGTSLPTVADALQKQTLNTYFYRHQSLAELLSLKGQSAPVFAPKSHPKWPLALYHCNSVFPFKRKEEKKPTLITIITHALISTTWGSTTDCICPTDSYNMAWGYLQIIINIEKGQCFCNEIFLKTV